MEAEARAHRLQMPPLAGLRTRVADGWNSAADSAERDRLQALWAERDAHDETLDLNSVLCEEALQKLDTAQEGDAPQSVVSDQGGRELATIDPEAPLNVDDGTVAGGLDPWHEDDDSCVSSFTSGSWSMMISANGTRKSPSRRQAWHWNKAWHCAQFKCMYWSAGDPPARAPTAP
jgi:hypothetical protein